MKLVDLKLEEPLYHFTTTSAMESILASGEFWLFDVSKSNDDRELSVGWEHFAGIMEAEAQSRLNAPLASRFVEWAEERYKSFETGSNKFYATCMTTSASSDRMWQEYSDGHKGVCMGFDTSAMKRLAQSIARPTRVAYIGGLGRREDQKAVTGLIQRGIDICATQYGKVDDDRLLFGVVPNLVSYLASSVKTSKWAYEGEVRFSNVQVADCSEPPAPSVLNPGRLVRRQQVKQLPDPRYSGESKGYMEAPFARQRRDCLDQAGSVLTVVLGADCEYSERDTEELLGDLGYRRVVVRRHHRRAAVA